MCKICFEKGRGLRFFSVGVYIHGKEDECDFHDGGTEDRHLPYTNSLERVVSPVPGDREPLDPSKHVYLLSSMGRRRSRGDVFIHFPDRTNISPKSSPEVGR